MAERCIDILEATPIEARTELYVWLTEEESLMPTTVAGWLITPIIDEESEYENDCTALEFEGYNLFIDLDIFVGLGDLIRALKPWRPSIESEAVALGLD